MGCTRSRADVAAPKKVDYARIEPAWRAGIKSLAQLAAEYTEATGVAVSGPAIRKHFEKLGVTRDLAAKVKAKADAMVLEAMVSGKVSNETTKTDAEIINKNAVFSATVQITHRQDIRKARELAMSLLAELEHQTGSGALYEQLAELLIDPVEEDDSAAAQERGRKRQEAFAKAMSLGGRTATMKALSETLRNLVGLEREAYGLGDKGGSGSTGNISITF